MPSESPRTSNPKGAVDAVLALMDDPDPFRFDLSELVPLQLAAINERLQQHGDSVPVLARMAEDASIDMVTSLEEAIPLLFTHSTYKSYPASYIEQGRWDRMCRWLDSISPLAMDNVDTDGIVDIDDWIDRLRAAGHFVITTSGTQGKCSFLDQSAEDVRLEHTTNALLMKWVFGMEPNQDRALFLLAPGKGTHRFVYVFDALTDLFARPGEIFHLSDRPITASAITRMAALRKAIAEGRALPHEIADFESAAAAREAETKESLAVLVDNICEHRREPSIIYGQWSQHYRVAQEGRARGIRDGDFHPETAIMTGGGLKGVSLPVGFEQDITRFYGCGTKHLQNLYGMAEMSGWFPSCPTGRYHAPPWIAVLILDQEGRLLLNPKPGDAAVVEGRMAFFDLAFTGRWGGMISGDNVRVDFGPCACGRPGPTLLSVQRYGDIGDDKLTCSGTIDAYVRGMVGA